MLALIADVGPQELGGITGVFAPDQITHDYINARARKANKSSSLYFQPDEGAEYAVTFEIDLSKIESFLALYPSPDNVVPVTEKLGMKFDGCFIGACTTTEEELILAALVLQVGLQKNLHLAPGKRQVVPGSLPIVKKLTELGLVEVYEDAGFTRAAPGCSLCLGMGADRADPGETWLSSQNRNFKNRMGQGLSNLQMINWFWALDVTHVNNIYCRRIFWQYLFRSHGSRFFLQYEPDGSSSISS